MGKRYTDTEKYKDNWFIDLKPDAKLLFYFLIDNVNNAGFWEESIRSMNFFLGLTEERYLGAKQGLARGLIMSDCGNIFYLKNFLKHQKNLPLNKYNNAHKSILENLKSGIKNFSQNIDFFYNLECCHVLKKSGKIEEIIEEKLKEYLAPNEPLFRGPGKGKGKGKGKGNLDLVITNTLAHVDLPEKIKKLFIDWVDVRVMCHGKLPEQSQDGQIKRLLEIPADLREESLKAAIAGTWKNIGVIQKKADVPEDETANFRSLGRPERSIHPGENE